MATVIDGVAFFGFFDEAVAVLEGFDASEVVGSAAVAVVEFLPWGRCWQSKTYM